jgi:hypothetical protein
MTKIAWGLLGVVLVAGCGSGGGTVALVGTDAGGAVADAGARPPDAGAPPPQSDASAGPPTTWTFLYTQLFANPSYPSNCTGSVCHDPGREHGIDFSTQATGYTSLRARVTPGAPDSSSLMTTLTSGYMPEGRPPLPAADLDRIRAWIQAGANND